MPIPDFQTIMSPLLAYTSDNNEHSLRDTAENLAVYFKLIPDERPELQPFGHSAVFDNRVDWTKMHLLKTDAIMDRLSGSAHRIELKGESLRKKM